LVAFGGAGPLHAARLARVLGIPRVIVPYGAGVGSAVGLLQADAKIDVSLTRVLDLNQSATPAIAAIYAELEAQAKTDLKRLGMAGEPRWSRYAYMRYAGQGYEVHTDLPDGPIVDEYAARAMADFHASYERSYRYRDPDAAIEAVDWYLVASLPAGRENGQSWFPGGDGTAARAVTPRQAYFPEAGGYIETAVVDRAGMAVGEAVTGPAIIEEPDSTSLVLPGDTARISPRGHLIIDIVQENPR
jgi:N-methylhydantoinase A